MYVFILKPNMYRVVWRYMNEINKWQFLVRLQLIASSTERVTANKQVGE